MINMWTRFHQLHKAAELLASHQYGLTKKELETLNRRRSRAGKQLAAARWAKWAKPYHREMAKWRAGYEERTQASKAKWEAESWAHYHEEA